MENPLVIKLERFSKLYKGSLENPLQKGSVLNPTVLLADRYVT